MLLNNLNLDLDLQLLELCKHIKQVNNLLIKVKEI